MIRYQLPAALIALSMAAPATMAQQQTLNANFKMGYRNGVCMVGFDGPGPDGTMTLQITRRLSDGNIGASVMGNAFGRGRDADPEENFPLTLTLDSGDSFVSRSGGYDMGGFSEGVWGGFGAGSASDEVYAALRSASSMTVTLDGIEFGPFALQLPGMAGSVLKSCADTNG